MPNRVHETPVFERRLKRLSKKYVHLLIDIGELKEQLLVNPHLGTSLGAGLYKLRLASTDKGKGKSGSFRTINYVVEEKEDHSFDVYFIVIYDKSEENSIDVDTLKKIVKQIWG